MFRSNPLIRNKCAMLAIEVCIEYTCFPQFPALFKVMCPCSLKQKVNLLGSSDGHCMAKALFASIINFPLLGSEVSLLYQFNRLFSYLFYFLQHHCLAQSSGFCLWHKDILGLRRLLMQCFLKFQLV